MAANVAEFQQRILIELGLEPRGYPLLTHRPNPR
jgi:hypothetical protein